MIYAAGAPPITRDGAQEAAQRELSKAIYHRYDEPWTERALKAIGHAIDQAVNAAGRNAPGGGIGALVIVVLVVGLLVLARWRFGALRRDRPLFSTGVAGDAELTAAEQRASAQRAAAAADWTTAVVAAMRAAAREVEERGWLQPRPGRTADEFAAEVAGRLPGTEAVLRIAARTFDAVVYGGQPATSDDYDSVAAADRMVRGVDVPAGKR